MYKSEHLEWKDLGMAFGMKGLRYESMKIILLGESISQKTAHISRFKELYMEISENSHRKSEGKSIA